MPCLSFRIFESHFGNRTISAFGIRRTPPSLLPCSNLISNDRNDIMDSNTNEGGIRDLNVADTRKMANGRRRSPYHILTDEEIKILKEDIEAIRADIGVFKFNEGPRTSYSDIFDEVYVKGDVLSDVTSNHPRDLMSQRAVLAHEYYGHRPYRNAKKKLPVGSWSDEFRASYMAARNAPGLSDDDRRYLVLDALERSKSAGVSITHNSFMRRVLYGY